MGPNDGTRNRPEIDTRKESRVVPGKTGRGTVERMTDDVMRAVTGLTARWAREAPAGNTVLSGLGLWPLLAILATAADEPGRSELAAASDTDAGAAATAAARLVETLDGSQDLHAALGVWVRDDLKLAESFDDVMPAPLRGILTADATRDKQLLDAWASEHTGGLIPHMPLDVTPDLVLALASALSVDTTWARPFEEQRRRLHDGPWAGEWRWLSRTDPDPATIAVYDGLVTATVKGEADVDVVLGLGAPEATAQQVLPALVELLGRRGTSGDDVLARAEAGSEPSPGLHVVTTTARKPDVQLSLPSFEVRAEHDLLEHADLFGLGAVSTPPPGRGHFSAISPEPLKVSQAKQSVFARFFATGFEAAAVTAIGMTRMAAMSPSGLRLRLDLDRPFAFAAVHRDTRLPIVAGWIAEPTERA
jgi:serpin (serine protease inhibitor)